MGVAGEVSPRWVCTARAGSGSRCWPRRWPGTRPSAAGSPDGIFWVTVGEHADLLAVQLDLLRRLDARGPVPSTVAEATERLREVLASGGCCWWSTMCGPRPPRQRRCGSPAPAGGCVYTSRDPGVIDAVGARPYRVDVLSADAARAVAAAVLDQPAAGVAGRWWIGCSRGSGGWRWRWRCWPPRSAAAPVAGRRSTRIWTRGRRCSGSTRTRTRSRPCRSPRPPCPTSCIEALLGLAVFPAGHPGPGRGDHPLLGPHPRPDPRRHRRRPRAVGRGGGAATPGRAHQLPRSAVRLPAAARPRLAELHERLITAYQDLLPAGEQSDWWRLPPDEPYIGDHLAHHLRGSGRHDVLVATVTDPAYLACRIGVGGTHAAEADLANAAAVRPDDPTIEWWQGWIIRHAHLLNFPKAGVDPALAHPNNVVPTLAAWLRADPTCRDHRIDLQRLTVLQPTPPLRLRWGLNPPPAALVRVLTGHTSGIATVTWSPDGSRIVSGGSDRSVRVWDADTGEVVFVLDGPGGRILSTRWSSDGSRMWAGGDEGALQEWNAGSGGRHAA